MAPSALKITIRDNMRRLLNLKEGESGVAAVMALGFVNGTAQRLLDDKTQIGVDKLAELAARLRVQPWQLCVPNLEPDNLPSIEPRSFRWPFRTIDPDSVTGLVGTAAAQVENGLRAVLATAGIATRGPADGARVVDPIPLADAQAHARRGLSAAPVPPLPPTKTPPRSVRRSASPPTERASKVRE